MFLLFPLEFHRNPQAKSKTLSQAVLDTHTASRSTCPLRRKLEQIRNSNLDWLCDTNAQQVEF